MYLPPPPVRRGGSSFSSCTLTISAKDLFKLFSLLAPHGPPFLLSGKNVSGRIVTPSMDEDMCVGGKMWVTESEPGVRITLKSRSEVDGVYECE